MKKHIGDFEDCNYCRAYIRLGESYGQKNQYLLTTRRLHKIAIARQLEKNKERERLNNV